MKFLQGITITIITAALGLLAYELCMTVTYLGGLLPMAIITAGPATGFIIARAAA